jgi:hypothetical protein
MLSLFTRAILGALLFTAAQTICGMIYAGLSSEPIPAPPGNPLPWNLAANLVYATTLTWITARSRLRGWRLLLLIGALIFGIMHVTSLIEARFFGLFGTARTLGLLAMSFASVVLFVLLFSLLLRSLPDYTDVPRSWSPAMTPLRLVTASFAYVVTYFGAGMFVFPFVRDFYATKTMPNPLELIAMQFFGRGPLFVLLLYMMMRASRAGRVETVLIAGTVLSVFGGVGLIVPNPFMPDAIRWAHLVEVGVSNFAYGCFVGWLLSRHRLPTAALHPQPRALSS